MRAVQTYSNNCGDVMLDLLHKHVTSLHNIIFTTKDICCKGKLCECSYIKCYVSCSKRMKHAIAS